MNRYIAAGILVASALATTASRADTLNTNYVVSDRNAVGLIRAFDDGSNTILQFVDLDHQQPLFTDAFGKRLSYRRVGDYAVLPGIEQAVRIAVDGNTAEVRAAADTPITWTPAPRVAPAAATPAIATAPAASRVAGPQPSPAVATRPVNSGAPVAAKSWPTTLHPMPATAGTLAAIHAPGKASEATSPAVPVNRPAPPVKSEPIWQARAGTDAKTMLTSWAQAAHWRVEWDAPFTYPIEAPLSYRGDFVTAVSKHFAHYTDRHLTEQPICVDLHSANSTVHVYLPDDSNRCNAGPRKTQ